MLFYMYFRIYIFKKPTTMRFSDPPIDGPFHVKASERVGIIDCSLKRLASSEHHYIFGAYACRSGNITDFHSFLYATYPSSAGSHTFIWWLRPNCMGEHCINMYIALAWLTVRPLNKWRARKLTPFGIRFLIHTNEQPN